MHRFASHERSFVLLGHGVYLGFLSEKTQSWTEIRGELCVWKWLHVASVSCMYGLRSTLDCADVLYNTVDVGLGTESHRSETA